MKEFLITFIMILILLVVFFLFGGFVIFDFQRNFWLAIFFCALIISFVINSFIRLTLRVEELESKLNEIESSRKDA